MTESIHFSCNSETLCLAFRLIRLCRFLFKCEDQYIVDDLFDILFVQV